MPTPDDAPKREYGSFRIDNGDRAVVYDTTNADAWIESDYYVTLGE